MSATASGSANKSGVAARRVVGFAAALVLLGSVIGVFAGSGRRVAAAQTAPFSGTASANGVEVDLVVPGGPVTSNLANDGGPTAQVAVSSLGTSTGYAAFPYPGDLIQSAPGLAAGLLDLGVAGLPPLKLPPLPGYPLIVSSNAQSDPDVSLGSGPYSLSANSSDTGGSASATAGLESAAGNTALLQSNASLTSAPGAVVVTASSVLQGLAIGPLTIGEITATATETRGPDGTITPSSTIAITGLEVGDIPITLSPDQLMAATAAVPLPVNATLASLLKSSGIAVSVEPAETFPTRVISPAIVITTKVNTEIGTAPGTLTLTTASATASLIQTTPSVPGSATAPAASAPSSPSIALPPTAGAPGVGTTPALGLSGVPGAPSAGASPALGSVTPSRLPAAASVPAAAELGLFDIRSVSLLLALLAVGMLAVLPVYRLQGGRRT
jgi:hypothetical protein